CWQLPRQQRRLRHRSPIARRELQPSHALRRLPAALRQQELPAHFRAWDLLRSVAMAFRALRFAGQFRDAQWPDAAGALPDFLENLPATFPEILLAIAV